MKKLVIMMMMVGCLPTMMKAQSAKYCMTYSDFKANHWNTIESLVDGRSEMMPQIKMDETDYKVKSGDKEADRILKKEVFAITFGKQLYVNCRNLRYNDIILDTQKYVQGYRYAGNKLLIAVYHINDGAFLMGLGADVASVFTPLGTSIALESASTALWLNRSKLNSYRCYLIDTDANEKGRYAVTRIDDAYMTKLLSDDAHILARYNAVSSKRERQSASNVLAVLTEKGLVEAEN
jgi:hypothetical protein